MDSDEDERKSHRVFPPRSFYPVPRPTSAYKIVDFISQTVTWGKCLCHSAEDEDGELTEFRRSAVDSHF